jgi:hypothetical protein
MDYEAVMAVHAQQIMESFVPVAEPLPDLAQTAQAVAQNAFARPVETMQALLDVAPIENVVGLYNSDGVTRIVKAGE